ncbi:MAG TPA: hypothetical protein VHP33_27415 [Polyangiaceae bacterium]|nr:hypothetical protein [Polyangiaceae bacterium]
MSLAIDVAIGLAFLYLLLALVVTTTQEVIATYANWRAKQLYAAIESMLQGAKITTKTKDGESKSSVVSELFGHSLLKNLRKNPKGTGVGQGPSYIPSVTFASALLDVLQAKRKPSQVTGASDVIAGAEQLVKEIDIPQIQEPLLALVRTTRAKADELDSEIEVVTAAIETWFNDRMARASGWYKRRAQIVGAILAVVVVGFFNADSIEIGSVLWRDSAVREAVVAEAKAYHEANAKSGRSVTEERSADDPIKRLEASSLPLGWDGAPQGWCAYLCKVAGLLISALAVSLGSGFWFNLLGRLLQLRGTGPRISPTTGENEGVGA